MLCLRLPLQLSGNIKGCCCVGFPSLRHTSTFDVCEQFQFSKIINCHKISATITAARGAFFELILMAKLTLSAASATSAPHQL